MSGLSFPTRSKILRIIEGALTNPPLFSYHYFYSKVLGTSSQDNPPLYTFVLSTGRCGTQTLAALFRLSKQTISFHEPHPRLGQLSKLAYEQSSTASTDVFIEAFLIARKGLIEATTLTGKHYIETAHYNTFLAPIINQALPNVKFIHLVRHPVDVTLSAVGRKWYVSNADDPTRIVPEASSMHIWNSYTNVQKNAWLWAETNRWIMEFGNTLLPDQYLRLQAEDVFAGKSETINQLYDFIGISQPSARRIERVLGKKLNAKTTHAPIKTQAVAIDAIWAITADVATQLGYSNPTGND